MNVYIRNKFYRIYVHAIEQWVAFLFNLQNRTNKSVTCSCGVEYVEYEKWIFRGQSDATWPLRSALERKLHKDDIHLSERALRLSESITIDTFKRDVMSRFSHMDNLNNIEWLGLMQHYGAPTRLLDFTYSAFISLFFAIDYDLSKDYAIWAIHLNGLLPPSLPYFSPALESKVKQVIEECQRDSTLDAFKCGVEFSKRNRYKSHYLLSRHLSLDDRLRESCARASVILGRTSKGIPRHARKPSILPIQLAYSNKRLTAQSGLFLMPCMLSHSFEDNLHRSLQISAEIMEDLKGLDEKKLDQIIHEAAMIQFIFDKRTVQEAKLLLDCSNISTKTLFPGLEGIARSIDYFSSIRDNVLTRLNVEI